MSKIVAVFSDLFSDTVPVHSLKDPLGDWIVLEDNWIVLLKM